MKVPFAAFSHHVISFSFCFDIYLFGCGGSCLLCRIFDLHWQPTPVFLPGESQGWGSLVGCCLWGHTELDMTEVTSQQQQQHARSLVVICELLVAACGV